VPKYFSVFVLDRYGEVITVCSFQSQFPTTIDQFWELTGVHTDVLKHMSGGAHVAVRMSQGWSKLDTNPRTTEDYLCDRVHGAMFQVSPSQTPSSIPTTSNGAEEK
jgi:hypothetical protein